VRPVLEHGREIARGSLDKILARDDERDAGGPKVLLRAGVDEAVLADVDRAAEDVASQTRGTPVGGVGSVVHSVPKMVLLLVKCA
jgi:hypothetical protein